MHLGDVVAWPPLVLFVHYLVLIDMDFLYDD